MPARLHIRLTKLTDERHRFAFTRLDGSGEARELETRSFLVHDLIHFAVESEAGLDQSFYGRLAHGAGLSDAALDGGDEALRTERIVGVLTGWTKARTDLGAFVAGVRAQMGETGSPAPPWFTATFVERFDVRLRGLQGAWKAVPFGQTMTLEFGAT